jgi:hypothetical protein
LDADLISVYVHVLISIVSPDNQILINPGMILPGFVRADGEFLIDFQIIAIDIGIIFAGVNPDDGAAAK